MVLGQTEPLRQEHVSQPSRLAALLGPSPHSTLSAFATAYTAASPSRDTLQCSQVHDLPGVVDIVGCRSD